MSALQPLEKSLNDLFGKQAPALPSNAKKIIVQFVPWLSLIGGALMLYSAYILWDWANNVSPLVDYANQLSAAYGGPQIADDRLTIGIWVGLIVLAIEGLLYLAAFTGTRARKKSGWDLLFYATLLNIAYGAVIMFTNYGSVGSFIGTLIGSAIGFYFLFQIRELYSGGKAKARKKA